MGLTSEQRDWLTLTLVPGVGTALFIKLLARFRTPHAVLHASQGALREVVGPKLAQRITQYADVADPETQERAMAEYEAHLITLEDPSYPVRLAEIYDPPLVLFVRGEFRDPEEPCVAVVGTRKPTPYGIRMAERFGRDLAAHGITVVSGMATGIDAAAHRGALEAGGRTIAVLGNGVDIVYPREHADLMHRIICQGCIVSQFPMGTEPSKGHFPFRNRVISGLSMASLIVEAPLRSGALITARQAAEQGREVFAIPGPIDAETSAGPHRLIQEGAKLVQSVDDILVDLELDPEIRRELGRKAGPAVAGRPAPTPAAPRKAPASLSSSEKEILAVLSSDGSFVDEIALACRIPVSEALSSLTVLELKGLVRQFSGKRFAPR